ncbi:hypothetical protein CFP65_4567 [Kitasatospora sp. MMS16-BH015]|uniref:hypothetical protein n=1 Tax=Kitasatospora sp. MMS16-BH015 TaxID=2018025 RepID=UPI000CA2A841|nr:hypothetical protein [Kitasatospora sp. MMS16-BH015]AUG79308.1 hypothetical protein CFP65_4567 [Kitasatospora sp. MMS16-BH015]
MTEAQSQPEAGVGQETLGNQSASGNHWSVIIQAQASGTANTLALVNIHEKELLPAHEVAPAVVEAARKAWVRADGDGKPISTAEEVRDVLMRGNGLGVVAGHDGSGRYAAAVRALLLVDRERCQGAAPLWLGRITPDWDPPDVTLLPVQPNCGYVLDARGETVDWSKEMPAKLAGHGRLLAKVGSCLIVIVGEDGWPTTGPEAGVATHARSAAPRRLVRSHLELLHKCVGLVERLQPEYEVKEGEQDLTHLITDGMHPKDAADLARLLAGAAGSEKLLAAAVERFTGWRDYVSGFFARTADRPDDRALLLSAVLLDGASPAQVNQAARDLLEEKVDTSVRNALSGMDLGSRLRDCGAKVADNKVTFTHRPGYPYAVLRHIWTELGEAQDPIRRWLARITSDGQVGAPRLGTIADLLAKLAAEHNDSTVLPSPTRGNDAVTALSRGEPAARMLSAAAQHPVLGAGIRKQLRDNWAPSRDPEIARVAALVCQGTFAAKFPGQALVRLRHVLGRDTDDPANKEAGRALRALVREHGKLAQTWAAVTDWIGLTGQTGTGPNAANRVRAGRRAFLALADITADPYPVELLLNAATHDKSVTDELVACWSATVSHVEYARVCEDTLTAWAEASVEGHLPADQVLQLIEKVVNGRIGLDPVAAVVVGRDTATESKAMREFRRRLIDRRFSPARPEQP